MTSDAGASAFDRARDFLLGYPDGKPERPAAAVVAEETIPAVPGDPDIAPTQPTPGDPVPPAEPFPTEPFPAEPLPGEPVTQPEPVPGTPVPPSGPTPGDPVPDGPTAPEPRPL